MSNERKAFEHPKKAIIKVGASSPSIFIVDKKHVEVVRTR